MTRSALSFANERSGRVFTWEVRVECSETGTHTFQVKELCLRLRHLDMSPSRLQVFPAQDPIYTFTPSSIKIKPLPELVAELFSFPISQSRCSVWTVLFLSFSFCKYSAEMFPSCTIPMYDDDVVPIPLAREAPPPSDGHGSTIPEEEPTTSNNPAPEIRSTRPRLLELPAPTLVRRRPKRPAVFVDTDAPTTRRTAARPVKKSPLARKDGRIPLSERKDFGNGNPRTVPQTPPQSPQTPATPFTPSVDDSNRFAYLLTPPPTPQPSPRPRVVRLVPMKPPVCMRLYSFLEMHDWRATAEEIKSAYKKVAVQYHPDKVGAESKDVAHDMMLCINAARDVLLDKAAREKYHKDGKLPTVFSHLFPGLC